MNGEPRGSRREIQAAETRRALLEAAKTLFVEKGYEATSIADIGIAARASKGTVYHHFTDKKEIFAEVFKDLQQELVEAALAAAADRADRWDRLEVATRTFVRSYVANRGARTMLRQALGVLGWDRVQELDEETSVPPIRAVLEDFNSSGEIVEVEPESTSRLIFGLYCQAILIVSTAEQPERVAATLEGTILAMLRGLRRSS